MKKDFARILFLAGLVAGAMPAAAEDPPFEADWSSLSGYTCPDWFRDAKFGIYAHWGVYSAARAPGNTDWYSRNLYFKGHRSGNHEYHVATFGPVDTFGYKDLVPLFTGEKFDAEAWVDLYVEAGARFAGPVGEHADGFAMWASKVNPWNAADRGPRRDVVAEMERAVRARGLKFVVSLHHQWLWKWYPTWDQNTDCADPAYASLYGPRYPDMETGQREQGSAGLSTEFQQVWLEKVKEVVSGYAPDLLWFDTRLNHLPEEVRRETLAFYYNHARQNGQQPVLTYKQRDLPEGTATLDLERSRMPEIHDDPWLTDSSISQATWAWASDLKCYSTDRLVDDLVDIVSKNGCLLLNVAPHPDGTIPPEQQERLRGIGKWLKLNGEAIYGSRPWDLYGEGPTRTRVGHLADRGFHGFGAEDIRFTTREGNLYAIALGWPASGTVRIQALGLSRHDQPVRDVRLLGHPDRLDWTRTPESLEIRLPATKPCEHAFVFAIDS